MSNNFRKTAVPNKIYKLRTKDSTEKTEGLTCARRPKTTF